MEGYISKKKIEQKIEEFKEIIENARNRGMRTSAEAFEMAIVHLEELLKEEN